MSKMETQNAAELAKTVDYSARKEAFERFERLKARAPLGTIEEIIEMRNQR